MSDLGDLLSAFDHGDLLRPTSDALNIVDLSRAVAGLCGAPDVEQTAGSNEVAGLIGPSEHLVFVLVDGLGMSLIEPLDPDSFLKRNLAASLTTVFPSSSATAITSLASGEWPNVHGVTGRWTYFPEASAVGEVLPYVVRGNGRSLSAAGLRPDQAFLAPSLLPRMTRDTFSLFPEHLWASVYSEYFTGGTPKGAYKSLSEGINQVVERVVSANVPTYTYLYTPRVDNMAHEFGSGQEQVKATVRDLDRELERLADSLGGRARMVVSADHGFLDAPLSARSQMNATEELTGGLQAAPSGDARVLYFDVRDGFQEKVQGYLQERFGHRFMVVTVDEAESLGLLGPGALSIETRRRVGDILAISRGAGVLEYRPDGKAGRIANGASHHSGLTPSEMLVPLVVA
jgi:predicted AlkP superfamily pyrophosphatase or phosphodiesterase